MEQVPDPAEEKPLGRVLSEERERQGLSRAEAAQRLHMSAYQIEALEIGDYTRLPQGTFLRGFVRNYSKILGLDPDAALSRLAEVAPPMPAPGIVVPSQNIRFDPLGDRFSSPYVKAAALAVVAVALVFAAMYWWLFIRTSPPASTAKAHGDGPPQQIAAAPMSAPEPVQPMAAPAEEMPKAEPPKAQAPKAEPPKAEAPKAEAPKAEAAAPKKTQPTPAPARAPQASSARGAGVIKFRFRGESWVEIKDGEGKVLLSKLNSPGSETEVEGRPPFTVIVGNAPEVRMLYNDRDFPLEPHTKVAVARFTLE